MAKGARVSTATRFPAEADTIVAGAVTSGNTNRPTTVIGERIAQSLLSRP